MRRSSGKHACDFVRSACGSDVRLRLTDEFASQTRGIHIRNRLCFLNGVPAARAATSTEIVQRSFSPKTYLYFKILSKLVIRLNNGVRLQSVRVRDFHFCRCRLFCTRFRSVRRPNLPFQGSAKASLACFPLSR